MGIERADCEYGRANRDSSLRLKLEELDVIEARLASVRPRTRFRVKVLVLFLFPVLAGAVVSALSDPTGFGPLMLALAALYVLATSISLLLLRRRLKLLERQRGELLGQIASPTTGDVPSGSEPL